MANTDEHFKILTEIVKSNPKGLCALSEVMQSHMKLSIDQRLSDDPLTALAAVMRHHGLEISSVDGITIAYIDAGVVLDIDTIEAIKADDIKPEK